LSDAAIVLSVIAGKDPNDKTTLSQPDIVPDFTKALDENALKGKRIGVPRGLLDDKLPPYMGTAFEEALKILSDLETTVVDPADLPSTDEIKNSNKQEVVTHTDFKVHAHFPLTFATYTFFVGTNQQVVRRPKRQPLWSAEPCRSH
jgi:amidase